MNGMSSITGTWSSHPNPQCTRFQHKSRLLGRDFIVPLHPKRPCLRNQTIRHSLGSNQSSRRCGWTLERDMSAYTVKITKSDAEFAEEGIEFVEGCEGIDLESLNDLFSKVDFPRRDPEKLQIALENTYYVLWIRYTKSSRFVKPGQILGFARVLSDGVFYASIWDVAVFPSWQRIGLGRALIERLLNRLVDDNIGVISLYAERQVVGLYEKLGFKKDPEGITGMAYSLK